MTTWFRDLRAGVAKKESKEPLPVKEFKVIEDALAKDKEKLVQDAQGVIDRDFAEVRPEFDNATGFSEVDLFAWSMKLFSALFFLVGMAALIYFTLHSVIPILQANPVPGTPEAAYQNGVSSGLIEAAFWGIILVTILGFMMSLVHKWQRYQY